MKYFNILLLAVLGMALVSCGGAEDRKAVYLEKARKSFNEGNYEKARIDLRNVLQIDPKDSEAYFEIGKVYHELKDYRKAYANYLKAEELNPDLLANQAKLGNIYLYLVKDIDKASEKASYILQKEPDNPDGLLLEAGIKVSENKIDEATSIVQKVIGLEPGHVDAALFLSSLYLKEKNYPDAIAVLDNALELNPDNARLTRFLAASLVQNKEYERAEVIFKDNLARKPDLRSNYLALSQFYNKLGDKSKAEEILWSSINNDEEDVERYFDLIKFISVEKGNKVAIDELRKLVKQKPGLGKLRIALAEYLYLNDLQEDAIEIYQQAVDDFPDEVTGVDARLALAVIYLKKQEIEKAGKLVDEVIAVSPNDTKANFLKAQVAINDNDIEKAIIALRIVTKDEPDNIRAFLLLAGAYKLNGNDELVNSTLNNAFEQNKLNSKGVISLARYYLSSDIDMAEKMIDHFNNMEESHYEGLSIKVAILNNKKQYDKALEVADLLIEKHPDKPNGYLNSVLYYKERGEEDKAISILEKGYLNTEDNRKILITLSALQAAEKQYDIVTKRLRSEIAANPDDDELRLILAKVNLAEKKLDAAESIFRELVEKDTKLEEAYLLLTQLVYKKNKDLSEIKPVFAKGIENIPTSIKIPLKLASVYEVEKNYDGAIALYRDMREHHPDNALVINNLISMLSDHGSKEELQESLPLMERLIGTQRPVYLDTVGWVYHKLGDAEKAIEYLEQVVQAVPDVNVFNYHLGMAYKASGDKEKAKEFLQKSLADGKPFREKEQAEAALKDL